MSGFDGITRKVSESERASVGGGKARGKNWHVIGPRSASARAIIARFGREGANDGAAELGTETRRDGDEKDGSDDGQGTGSVIAAGENTPTACVSNDRDRAVASATTPDTTVAVGTSTATTTTEATAHQAKGAEPVSISVRPGPPTRLGKVRSPSSEKSAATNKKNGSGISIFGRVREGMRHRRASKEGSVDTETYGGVEVASKSTAGRSGRGGGGNKNTAAAKLGGVLAALPLSKLKIVIGKHNSVYHRHVYTYTGSNRRGPYPVIVH